MIAAFFTGVGMLLFFGIMEFISYEMYEKFLKYCYSTTFSMIMTSVFLMLVYLLFFVIIFVIRLNEITDTIKKISTNIHKLAQGDFREKLSVNSNHELGDLANDINIMAERIDIYIKNEHSWNEERYHMITNMSHDLKTPVMSISGYIDLLKNGKYKDEDERNSFCEIISNKTNELSVAINQLFELSSLHSNTLQLQKVKVQLCEFMEQVVLSYIPMFEEREMNFRISIPSQISIMIDPGLMKRVFENIILNAIKYASCGKYLDICAETDGDNMVLHFINYGPMIPQEDLEHIFKRYYRVKRNLDQEGNGLGLEIARTIVELHEATIQVLSTEEKTDFYLVFKK